MFIEKKTAAKKRRSFLVPLIRLSLANRTAGGLNLGLGSCGARNLNSELLGEFAVTENLDFRALVVGESGLGESLDGDFGTGFELLLEIGNVDTESLGVERRIVEATLRNTADEGHLATFEAEFLLVTLAGALTLVTARGRLAHARAAAAADALPAMASAGCVGEI